MKKILMLMAFISLSFSVNSQNIRRDSNNNFYAVTGVLDTAKRTGQSFKDGKGNVYEVFVSAKGKYFVYKVSAKTGLLYKYYLKFK